MTDPWREEPIGVGELGEFIADENAVDGVPAADDEPAS